ncbi:hypothetical protein PSCICM_28400 [Pseudomonas cichorii]|uniref:Uncharacterized protein n=1 Tax=Pseudomonas cichorii TaxID=36746 RepID=A0ABQ1DUF4_PSECI|nr:hypothetical protein PSCICM_28400 [Pseudomonas cichorii]GFM94656.1 hypothetical protein PSCICP_46280 [Pseudomonas cichorii]
MIKIAALLLGVEGSILRLGSWNTGRAVWDEAGFIKNDSNFLLYNRASTGLNVNSIATIS